jgi:hypothetical protein
MAKSRRAPIAALATTGVVNATATTGVMNGGSIRSWPPLIGQPSRLSHLPRPYAGPVRIGRQPGP